MKKINVFFLKENMNILYFLKKIKTPELLNANISQFLKSGSVNYLEYLLIASLSQKVTLNNNFNFFGNGENFNFYFQKENFLRYLHKYSYISIILEEYYDLLINKTSLKHTSEQLMEIFLKNRRNGRLFEDEYLFFQILFLFHIGNGFELINDGLIKISFYPKHKLSMMNSLGKNHFSTSDFSYSGMQFINSVLIKKPKILYVIGGAKTRKHLSSIISAFCISRTGLKVKTISNFSKFRPINYNDVSFYISYKSEKVKFIPRMKNCFIFDLS